MGPPNHRTIAARAGVSNATVSLALRGDPRISPATRNRVLAAAAALGYRPNGLVAALMTQVRQSRPVRWRAALAVLLQRSSARAGAPLRWLFPEFRAGVHHRAEQLGFSVDELELEATFDPARLKRVLGSRGIRGVIIPSLLRSQNLTGFPSGEVAAATIGHRVLGPDMPRVQTAHAESLELAWTKLAPLGFRRPGLLLMEDNDPRTNAHFLGPYLVEGAERGWPTPLRIDPRRPDAARRFARWIRAERPDLVLHTTSIPHPVDWIRQLPARSRRPRFIGLVLRQAGPHAGVIHDLRANAAACVDLVAAAVLRNEIPSPAANQVILIKGRWHEGIPAIPPGTRAEPRGDRHP